MMKKFHKYSKLVQVIVLIIPFVNWIVEMVLRWDEFLSKKGLKELIVALIATFFFGNLLGWIDAILVLLTDKLLLE